MKIRIGVVDFVNARPLVHGLDRERGVELVRDRPGRLAQALRRGDLDVALVSSIECFRSPALQIVPEIGICSEGPVRSVKLFLKKPLEQVEKVALDAGSRTGAALVKMVFVEFLQKPGGVACHEIEPTLEPAKVEADAVLLIGDAALRAKPVGGSVEPLDLGWFWTDRTGLPFVYAVWACRRGKVSEELLALLLRARDRGLMERSKIAAAAAAELDLPVAGLTQYLTRNLRYQLGEREIKGLERFRDIGVQHNLCNRHDVPFLKVRMHAL
jgi:chorismate dehydratase